MNAHISTAMTSDFARPPKIQIRFVICYEQGEIIFAVVTLRSICIMNGK